MRSPFFVTANDTPNHPQKERRNMAFRSMFFMGLKLQLVEIHLFPTFTVHCKKIPFATPLLQLLRVSFKYLTIRIDYNQKVAEMCEFDRKTPLFGERAMSI